jgi:hypothetical protein
MHKVIGDPWLHRDVVSWARPRHGQWFLTCGVAGRAARAPTLPGPYGSCLRIVCLLRCVSLAGHSRPVTEDEAKTVAALAAQCLTWGG